MSEPDSTPQRRPPTIDLTAKEVETETTASTENSAGAAAAAGTAPQRHSGVGPYAIGILVGAVVVAAIAVGVWLAGLVPAHEATNPPAAKAVVGDDVSSRLDKIQDALRTPRTDEAVAARITAAETQAKSLTDTLAALTHRVDDIAADARSAAAAAEEARHAAQASGQHADIAALADRLEALESVVKSLRADVARHAANADDTAARAIVAAEALRAAVERGAPYQAELAAAKSLGADAGAVATLARFAAGGAPTSAALGRELASLVPALERAAEPKFDEASFLGRLQSEARRLVRITPLNVGAAAEPTGNDAAAVMSRLAAAAARNDIAAALTDLAGLPDAARAPAAMWIETAQARQEAIAASQRIAADALAAITKSSSQ